MRKRTNNKPGRNEKCPCGSNKKLKHCHGEWTLENANNAYAEFINRQVLKKPDLNVCNDKAEGYPFLTRILEEQFKKYHERNKLILPDLSAFDNESIGIFSDYSGEGAGDYYIYSILICAWNLRGAFQKHMMEVRKKYKLGKKEIAYKDLRMGQMQAALEEYLGALNNQLPGFLLTLAVHKNVLTLFGPHVKETKKQIADHLKVKGMGDWKPDDAEKLLRVTHLIAFLIGLLGHTGQKIFWMTDHDNISANPEKHRGAMSVLNHVLPKYVKPGVKFTQLGGAVPFKDRDVSMLDLLSITDIVAGTLQSFLTQKDNVPTEQISMKKKTDLVLRWLANDGVGVKKMNMVMRITNNDKLESANLLFSNKDDKSASFIPIYV